MAFVHHTMLTAENLRGLPSKQLHTNVEPHYSPRSRAAPTAMWGGGSGRCLFEACDWRTFWTTIRISLLQERRSLYPLGRPIQIRWTQIVPSGNRYHDRQTLPGRANHSTISTTEHKYIVTYFNPKCQDFF